MANKLHKSLLKVLEDENHISFNEWLEESHPIDLAEDLNELDQKSLAKFYKLANDDNIAAIIEQAEEELQLKILKLIATKDKIRLFTLMSADNVVDIMGKLPFDERKKLLRKMKDRDAVDVRDLLGYDEESAGGLMTTEYIALNEELSAVDALSKIKDIGLTTEIIETIFILDSAKKLVGTVDIRNILAVGDHVLLKEITEYNVVSVMPNEDQENVALLVSKYDLNVVPVVNKSDKLLGIITVDDIIDVIEAEHTEDMFRMVGVNEEEAPDSSLFESVHKRFPWLFVNLGTAFLAAFTVGLFEDTIAQVAALAVAMPIVAGMGGNAGTQTLSVVIRGIALGEIDLRENWKIVFKEIGVGLINGVLLGILTGLIVYLYYGNFYLGLIIFLAMIGNLIIAAAFGFLIPLFLELINVDPALASAIFLTTATDVFGFFIFLGLAQLMLNFLI